MNRFDRSERTVRRWIRRLNFTTQEERYSAEVKVGKLRQYDSSKKYYLITWAQNATPVHSPFWNNILAYAEFLDANVGVIQGRYQNPTSVWSKNMKKDEWWDEAFNVYETTPTGKYVWEDEDGNPLGDDYVTELVASELSGEKVEDKRVRKKVKFSYLDGARHNIHTYVDLISDIKITPTAVNPLSGLQGVSGNRTSIIGHPRVHLQSLPVLQGYPNKFLLTTGACTIKNYTDTKAGKKSEFHHTYGFVILEIEDAETFHIRQVTALEDGSFTDLWFNVKDNEVSRVDTCAAYIMGDVHHSQMEKEVMNATYRLFNSKIVPRRLVIHDLFDGESVNHHIEKDPIERYKLYKNGGDVLHRELENTYKFLETLLQYDPIVVRSNHDERIDKWIMGRDWKQDIPNAKEYMEYGLALLNGDAEKGVLPYLIEKKFGDRVTCLDNDDSYRILGWELAHHGHLGIHGSRGSVNQYRKLNTKVITGHSHVPERKDGALSVGTYTKMRLGYNRGASAWAHCGIIVHNDGKAQHIIFSKTESGKYKFTTLK